MVNAGELWVEQSVQAIKKSVAGRSKTEAIGFVAVKHAMTRVALDELRVRYPDARLNSLTEDQRDMRKEQTTNTDPACRTSSIGMAFAGHQPHLDLMEELLPQLKEYVTSAGLCEWDFILNLTAGQVLEQCSPLMFTGAVIHGFHHIRIKDDNRSRSRVNNYVQVRISEGDGSRKMHIAELKHLLWLQLPTGQPWPDTLVGDKSLRLAFCDLHSPKKLAPPAYGMLPKLKVSSRNSKRCNYAMALENLDAKLVLCNIQEREELYFCTYQRTTNTAPI